MFSTHRRLCPAVRKGHSLGAGNAVVRGIVSSWQISGIVTFRSGSRWALRARGAATPVLRRHLHPSYNPNFTGPVRINGSWGSGNALARAPSPTWPRAHLWTRGIHLREHAGSAAFGLFAPFLMDEDISLRREFVIHERLKVSIAGMRSI